MHQELEHTLKGAGIDPYTPVDTVFQMQQEGRAFLAIDYQEQHDIDDMLERSYAGESCWITANG